MGSLNEKFLRPLPGYIKNIEKETLEKISATEFVKECQSGDTFALKRQFLGLWPFVDQFPDQVISGCWGVLKPRILWQFGIRDLLELYSQSRKTLSSISSDEKTHRVLWLESSDVLGLEYPADFRRKTLPAVQGWIDSVGDNNPFKMFLGIVAIEMIAESVSVNMLTSQALKDVLGKRGIRWFQVHIVSDHAAMTHEQLALRLAFAMHPGEPTEKECNEVVQNVVASFLKAGEACSSLDLD